MSKSNKTLNEQVANSDKFYEFKVGRPCLFKSEVCGLVIPLFEAGLNKPEVAAALGVSTSTLDNWRADHPEFKKAYEIGTTKLAARYCELGREGMLNEINVNSSMWIFAMKNIAGWKEKIEAETTSTNYTYTIYKDEENL